MIQLNDQLNREVVLSTLPKRIVSLVPSQTELLHHLGLDNEVIGITKFCIHPDQWFQSKTRVGGTKNVNLKKVASLLPDLIIANKEENTEADIEALNEICPVYVSDINSVDDAFEMIKHVGLLTGKEQLAVDLLDDIQDDFENFPNYSGKVLYFIWREPYMVCGTNNFIHAIISELGFTNAITAERYVELSNEQIADMDIDFILLSTEPFPFEEKNLEEFQKLTNAEIKIVDGEMFSWYGSRMLKMKNYFNTLL